MNQEEITEWWWWEYESEWKHQLRSDGYAILPYDPFNPEQDMIALIAETRWHSVHYRDWVPSVLWDKETPTTSGGSYSSRYRARELRRLRLGKI